ncbi:MAG TPA: hypothetical protein VIM19_14245 [Actinomycetes bacterium]
MNTTIDPRPPAGGPRVPASRVYDPDGGYDGQLPFPALPSPGFSRAWRLQVAVTLLLVAGPLAAVVLGVRLA